MDSLPAGAYILNDCLFTSKTEQKEKTHAKYLRNYLINFQYIFCKKSESEQKEIFLMTFCSKKMYIKTITFPCSDWGINFVVIKDFPFFLYTKSSFNCLEENFKIHASRLFLVKRKNQKHPLHNI